MKTQEKAAPVISPVALSKCSSSQYGAVEVHPSERFGSLGDNSVHSSLSLWKKRVPCSLFHSPLVCTYPYGLLYLHSLGRASSSPYHMG